MKKILFASTALVAAGLMGAGSAEAAEKIKLQLGGFSKWWVVGSWQDDTFLNNQRSSTQTDTSVANVDVKGDNEIFFGGETTLDNGLKVGVTIELEAGGTKGGNGAGATADTIDKSFVFVEGGFGKVILGTEANGTVLLHVMAPDAAGNWGGENMTYQAVVAPSGFTTNRTTTEIDVDDNAEKITYVAPTFYGLTVGGSYISNAVTEDNQGVEYSVVDAWGVGALYANTFGGVGVKVSAGYVTYDLGAGSNTGTSTGGGKDWEMSAGTQLSYAGFTLGGSYRLAKDDENSNATASRDGNVWDVGLQYATGPYAVSFSYLRAEARDTIATGGDDTLSLYQLSGKYAMGPGVDLLATASRVKFDEEAATVGADNDGYVVMTGLSLAF